MTELLLLTLWLGSATPTAPQAVEAGTLTRAVQPTAPGPLARAAIAPIRAAPPNDHWFAEDKARHATMSFAATPFAYGAASVAGLEHDDAVLAAAGFALAAGIWKEIRDERIGSGWSAKDLVWDALGVAVGVLWVREIR